MRNPFAMLTCLALLAPAVAGGEEEAAYSADSYASCAACHLADGAGIPGAFPPLRNRVAAIAALEGGWDYLITVVSSGLMGTIEAGGAQYFGVMPGNKGPMSATDIAAALNYAVFELLDDKEQAAGIAPVTAENVSAVQEGATGAGPTRAAEMRAELVESEGDAWPR